MSASAGGDSPALGSIDALKRVKATETDWDLKLRAARGAAEMETARLKDESEEAVRTAQQEAEAERARAVQAARADADREAEQILVDGSRAAEEAARGEGKRPADRATEILSTVLAGFTTD